ncbi:chaperone for protein-folding within the ER, fungal-domain-containing protein [Amanita rubescens]|nr:chaperone for protein-folding within the ER, fungal-domain-containing protein [Amanita rubescens]
MLFTYAVALLLAISPLVYSQTSNAPLIGTWSSGSKAVETGPGFANPVNRSFIYPQNTGMSYSFTADGYYEIARYRMNGNGSQPTCITGVMNWAHGMYTLQPNGSITMIPFNDDGFQQIQNPCGAISDFIETYNLTELYTARRREPLLQMYQFNGAPLPPLFQISTTPNILPTQQIRQTTPVVAKRELIQRSNAAGQHITVGLRGAVGLFLFALTSTLLL